MHIVSSLIIIMFKLVKSCKKVSSMHKNKKNYKKKKTMGKGKWQLIKPRKFGYDLSVQANERTSVRPYKHLGRGEGHTPNNRLTERHATLVYCVFLWYGRLCYDQLTPVKTRYLLTSIT